MHAQIRLSPHVVATAVKHRAEPFSKDSNRPRERRRACEAGDFPAATNELLSLVPFRRISLIERTAQAVETGLPRILQGGITDLIT